MYIYLLIFAIAIFLTYIAQLAFKEKKNSLGILLSVCVITILSLLAGVRDNTVGTDVRVYMESSFRLATMATSFSEYSLSVQSEFLYTLLNYCVAFVTNNLHIFMFIVEAIIVTLVYMTIYYYRKKIPMWVGLLVFLTLYYNRTFNLIRQSLALAITFFAFRYIDQDKKLKYIITIIIATLFHSTAFVAGLIYVVKRILGKEYKHKVRVYFIIILVCIAIANYGTILSALIYDYGILPVKYAIHIPTGEISIPISETILKIMLLLPIVIYSKKLNEYNSTNRFLLFIIILDFILLQTGMLASYVQRISFYFGFYYILLLPQIFKVTKNNKYGNIVKLYIVGVLLFYWYYMFIRLNYGETYPYTSEILNIV